ncbi:MAG TPA: class I SAM-dependent methyltransferase [Candidatus Baltobacteraceae bacterium]|jgi:ubiquinone/menaquinone biosynthesis C-methylase UbiE|nr:class I SAM-dependent methyltransferase [Candidatus Baltobacteraceae bacterium]
MEYLPTGRALIDPFNALEKAGIREEMRVADFGVGAVGHFLFPAAKLVGQKGHVYGVDILKSVLQANQSRAKISGFDNVEMVWGNIDKLNGSRLPDASMDMVVIVNVLHAVDKAGALQESMRVLATGGVLMVVEWKTSGAALGPAPERRLTKEDAIAAATTAGFLTQKEFDAGPYHYGLVFKKA